MSDKPVTYCKPVSILYLIYGFRIGEAARLLLDLCKDLDRKRFRPEVVHFHRDEEMLTNFLDAGIPCRIFQVKNHEFTFSELFGLSRMIRNVALDQAHVNL